MDREAFLSHVAARLGRKRHQAPSTRDAIGVPAFHREAALEGDGVERFARELSAVGGECLSLESSESVDDALHGVLERFAAKRIVTWARSEFAEFELARLWARGARAFRDPGLIEERALRAESLRADVGITTVDYAIAETGTVVLSASVTRPRGVSLLPALHVALVDERQIVPRLGDALEGLSAQAGAGALPSAVHFVTGPSRTSDIENDLTIGVHGPAAVVAIVRRRA
jgi:L-lactate dehydrogenase complex protein LldG